LKLTATPAVPVYGPPTLAVGNAVYTVADVPQPARSKAKARDETLALALDLDLDIDIDMSFTPLKVSNFTLNDTAS
jgi:hypothetical protein